MSISRMSYSETPEWRDAIGFIVRPALEYQPETRSIIVKKGSLVYGFQDDDKEQPTYGYLVDSDEFLILPQGVPSAYITLSKNGIFPTPVMGNFENVKGIGANINGIPWYTFDDNALIAKVFFTDVFVSSIVVCDDPYWCEFEGNF